RVWPVEEVVKLTNGRALSEQDAAGRGGFEVSVPNLDLRSPDIRPVNKTRVHNKIAASFRDIGKKGPVLGLIEHLVGRRAVVQVEDSVAFRHFQERLVNNRRSAPHAVNIDGALRLVG